MEQIAQPAAIPQIAPAAIPQIAPAAIAPQPASIPQIAPQPTENEPAAEFVSYMAYRMAAYNPLNTDGKIEYIRERSINSINTNRFQDIHILANEGDRLNKLKMAETRAVKQEPAE